MSQYYILRYSQGWNQHEVLVHHTDFQANGIARTGYVCELAINVNLTAIRVNKTIENVHQRRFTCTILAYQSMNLAFTHLEIDMIVGNDAGPGFSDVAHLHCKRIGLLLGCSLKCAFQHR